MNEMTIPEAKQFVSKYPTDVLSASIFGFPVKRINQNLHFVDWGILPIVTVVTSSISMCHDSLVKNRLLYRLDHMDEVVSGEKHPYIVTIDGVMVAKDGNHRLACLSMLGYKYCKCRLFA